MTCIGYTSSVIHLWYDNVGLITEIGAQHTQVTQSLVCCDSRAYDICVMIWMNVWMHRMNCSVSMHKSRCSSYVIWRRVTRTWPVAADSVPLLWSLQHYQLQLPQRKLIITAALRYRITTNRICHWWITRPLACTRETGSERHSWWEALNSEPYWPALVRNATEDARLI